MDMLLEMLVCDQTTLFMESNKLLPANQHGFRAKRSTMTAWANLQRDWTQNTDEKSDRQSYCGTSQQLSIQDQ